MARAECLTNPYAAEEARRNLELKDSAQLPNFRTLLAQCTLLAGLTTDLPVSLDPKDISILGGAIVARATHLLTGDGRHLGKHCGKALQGVRIVSPKMMADELVAGKLLRREVLLRLCRVHLPLPWP